MERVAEVEGKVGLLHGSLAMEKARITYWRETKMKAQLRVAEI